MRFSFTDDQRLFAEGLRDLLSNECPASHVRETWDDGTGHSPGLWRKLGEMGVLSILVPEEHGGMGASPVDSVLLFQELGRAAVPGPVLEHMSVVAPTLAAIRPGVVDGSWIGTLALESESLVPHASASHGVLTGEELVEDFAVADRHGIDGGRRLAAIDGGRRTAVDVDVERARLSITLATSAYLVGLGERMIDIAAEYARQREQFGKPIGSFQAVKHLMSDALLKVEFAKAPTYRAAWSLASGSATADRDVSMAKALASEAAYRASRGSMQVLGGIGYTWEADLQLFMKKSWALMRAHGDAVHHRRRVGASVLGS